MKQDERKAATAAYKKRVPPAGVYTITCRPSGEVWLGASGDLDKIENRHRFTLKTGGHSVPALQRAWRAHGEAAFAFERLAVLKEEEAEMPLTRDRLLKELCAYWQERLGAKKL